MGLARSVTSDGDESRASADRLHASTIPNVQDGERPTAYADRVGEWYVSRRSSQQRKDHGLFLTPVAAADFMARQIAAKSAKVRVLDPAAGSGTLCCAVVEAIMSQKTKPKGIRLVAYEIDAGLIAPLRAVLDYLADWCRARHRVSLDVEIAATDFVMANARALRPRGLFAEAAAAETFDVVISNPPYFKVAKDDPRAELRAMRLPLRDAIVALGRRTRRLAEPMAGLDTLVMDMVASPRSGEVAVG